MVYVPLVKVKVVNSLIFFALKVLNGVSFWCLIMESVSYEEEAISELAL